MGIDQRTGGRAKFVGPHRDDPGAAGFAHQRVQQFDARRVGVLQIVDDDHAQAVAHRLLQQRLHGDAQARPLTGRGSRPARAEFGQHVSQIVALCRAGPDARYQQQRAQPAGCHGVGHGSVAGPRADRDVRARSWTGRVEQVRDQARLADAGFADEQHDRPFVDCASERQTLGVAPKQARRTQHAGRHGAVDDGDAGNAATLDGGQQGQRLGRRRGTDLILEHPFAAVEGQQRGGPVAAQVVQANQAPVRSFGQRLQRQQLLRVRQRIAPVAGVFGNLGQLGQRVAHAATAAAALLLEPVGKLAGGHRRGVAEHAVGVVEVVRDALGQGEGGAAGHGLETERLAQREQALAQRIACGVGVAFGPQQGSQARAWCRAFECQPCQEGGIARRQGMDGAVADDAARRAGKL